MIILPDLTLSRGKILPPVKRRNWLPSSQSVPLDQMRRPAHQTLFRLTARTHDGRLMWEGWFEDRDDADAFLFAVASGSLIRERFLWDLPIPAWHPGISTDLAYHFATVTFLTATGANSYSRPSDWNDGNNSVECLGGAGSGAVMKNSSAVKRNATGASGGGYGKKSNLTLSSSTDYSVGTGGTAVSGASANGNDGGDTWFNGASYAAATVGGAKGLAGIASTSVDQTGPSGGSGKGDSSATGGSGGSTSSGTAHRIATGGGGAAGPNGNGNNGSAGSLGTPNTAGGSGDAGSGGTGGNGGTDNSTDGANGGDGTEFQASPARGSGGGGGGSGGTSRNSTGGSGGNYGGAGAGATATTGTPTSGAGIQGLIAITYTPLGIMNFNSPMLGM